ASLNTYLQLPLVLVCGELDPGFQQAQNTPINKLDVDRFPLVFSASISRSFAVSKATLNLNAGASAYLDLLTGAKAEDLGASLNLDIAPSTSFLSLALRRV